MPSNSWNAANYSVDVTFLPEPLPGQVTGVTATAGRDSATVSWSAPATGGRPSSYVVTPHAGSTALASRTVSGSPPATSATVSGLDENTSYTFTVAAANAAGSGADSTASGAITPLPAVLPGAPTGVSAEPASRSARVSWTAPTSDGGKPVTGYVITPYLGATAQSPVSVGAGASATVTGLANGSAYTFTVAAQTGAGTGPASTASSATTPQAMIFDLQTPDTIDAGDPGSVNLGVKFRSDLNGKVTGLRFYKSTGNTGTHVGSLWDSSGTLLGRATFTNESGSGWQTVQFATPVQIDAGTTYVASYLAPNGHYSLTPGAFGSAVINAPLRALDDGTSSNGLYDYGSTPARPVDSWNAANYWVDVTFLPEAAPGQVTGVTASAGQASANVSWSAPSGGGRPTSYEVTPYNGSTALSSKTVTGTPLPTTTTITGLTPGVLYTFKVRAINDTGPGQQSAASSTINPEATIFKTQVPAIDDSGEGNSVNVGVKFRSDVDGSLTGVRFYKTSTNTGFHVGSLWSASGTLLAQANFTGESASGWQTVKFATPVAVTAGTTYIASYLAPNGHYSLTSSAFASTFDSPPLHVLADGATPNGVYAYSSTTVVPTSSFNAANYWVDVTFAPSPGAGS